MSLYQQRGVSAQKEDVHKAIRYLDKGLFPRAFCKISPDYLTEDPDFVNIMHADGAGTKSVLAYLYWKETGDLSVWKGIAQDAVVMNLDDLLCVGVYNNILFSSTIDRNATRIPAEILEAVINGTNELLESLRSFGIHIHYLGGETADVGDVVRTITVNGTMTARWPLQKLITNQKIKPGNVIVGLASYGRSSYEAEYNSGIGSNGLTSARHDVLHNSYSSNYPETYEPLLNSEVVYIGSNRLTDTIMVGEEVHSLGKLLLSPTKTFAPVIKTMLEEKFEAIHGLVHCSGGGQTKCLKYVPDQVKVIKDNLFDPPEVFRIIQKNSGAALREMYQVFNMGTRMEIYTQPEEADDLIQIAHSFGVEAKIIGKVEASSSTQLIIKAGNEILQF